VNGPTLNPEYNHVLSYWASIGENAKPECEDCGRDLTGQEAIEEDKIMWVCTECHAAWEEEDPAVSTDQARAWERSQMGIGT
jgi:hypothetical protein